MTLSITNEDGAGWGQATWPLGAEWDEATGTASFAVYAPVATRVLLEFYPDAVGADAVADAEMARCPDGVWRARIGGIEPGVLYAFRVWGPGWDVAQDWTRGDSGAGFTADFDTVGNRFNPNKVLFDPYAREISHNLSHPALAGTQGATGAAEVRGTGGVIVRGRPHANSTRAGGRRSPSWSTTRPRPACGRGGAPRMP
jgi:isoamylase